MSADPITARCAQTFKPALHDSGARETAHLRWVVLHDEEAPSAYGAAEWFRNPESGGSAHVCVDDAGCYRCLDDDVIPWGAASSFGANSMGLHIEQAGYARYSAVVWKRHRRTLERAAYRTARFCRAYGIPIVFRTAAELELGLPGITTHAEVSKASRRQDPAHAWVYSHSDPGPLWPRRLFMRYVRQYARLVK